MRNFELGKAVLSLETDDSKYAKGIADAEGKATKLGGTFGKISAAGKVMAGVIGGTVVGALSDAARAAAEDEANTLKLQSAIDGSGASYEELSGQIDAAIKRGQDLAFSDADVRDSIAQLTDATGDAQKALDLQTAAMDIARAKSIDLGAATDIVQKAALGQFGALKKIGIVLDEGATATEALGAIQEKFAGRAEKYGQTTEAAIFKVKDSFGEFTEGIGASLGPMQGMIAMLPGLKDGMGLAGGAIGGLSHALGIQRTGMMLTIPVAGGLNIALGPLVLVIGAIALAAGLLALAWSNNFGDIRGKTKVALEFLGRVFDGFKGMLAGWGLGIIGIVRGAINTVVGILNGLIDAWNAVAEKLGLPLLGKIKVDLPNLDWAEQQLRDLARPRTASVFALPGADSAYPGQGMFHGGTDFVPRTGTYLLERGEAVISRADNERGAGGATSTINAYGIGVAEAARLIARENERMLARRASLGSSRRR